MDIENTGGAGTETLDLSTSDTLIGSRSITLDGGESASTELVWTPPAPGVYTVCGAIQESERCTEINVTEARCTVNSFLQSQGIDAEVPVVGETPCLLALLGGIGVGITLLAVD
ncbi:MAG: hypothetical protein GWN12_09820 [Thermoplasmata archaeon]|nr:hypothetical protein [Thermoplasmata archaeon]NIT78417.1 hypothetical protein [Thermoplasmata archaeon]NIW89057.1 hypothetical protein [Thermoplasmata archaeon]NIY04786.1 hypothetical protein [Thermoplasmata archaeon]